MSQSICVETSPESGDSFVEYCGERTPLHGDGLTIGRAGDVVLDASNRFLHRIVVHITEVESWWFINNVGRHLAVDVADEERTLEAVLGPRASMPLTTRRTTVRLSAGPTRYEFDVVVPADHRPAAPGSASSVAGDLTDGHLALTNEQKQLVVVLAEAALRDGRSASITLPTSAQAAHRLGWTVTKFNRKLDNVCAKLSRQGVRGLHGDVANLAFRRRSRLVDYCVRTQLVVKADLVLLEALAR